MTGMPWSQALGISFLASWVVIEVMAWSWRQASQSWFEWVEEENDLVAADPNDDAFYVRQELGCVLAERLLLALALVFHAILLVWALSSFWPDLNNGSREIHQLPNRLGLELVVRFLVVMAAGSLAFPILTITDAILVWLSCISRRRCDLGIFRPRDSDLVFWLIAFLTIPCLVPAWLVGVPKQAVLLKLVCVDFGFPLAAIIASSIVIKFIGFPVTDYSRLGEKSPTPI